MLKGGIIMDVTDAAQAKIAEEAGVRLWLQDCTTYAADLI